MSVVVDNLIAYRFLTILVTPFPDTQAFKLGIIDAEGTNLIKTKNLKTTQQREAYTYLHKLAFNIKKLLNKLPGGESMLKNLVAALLLLREAHESGRTVISEQELRNVIEALDTAVYVDEQILVQDFLMLEDAPANATGAAVSTDAPVIRRPRKFAKFVVNDEVFSRFSKGKEKYRKWSDYLNLEDEGQQQIYKFARRHPNGVIILQNGQQMKSIRYNPVGGGSWSKIQRPIKQVNNEVV